MRKDNTFHQSQRFTPLELKKAPQSDGTFSGYASVFGNVDNGLDIVEKGAFTESLRSGRKVKMLWQHDVREVIGVWTKMEEDDRGLYVEGQLLSSVQKGAEALALLKADALDGMSIGFRTIEAADAADGRIRRLLKVDLFEISLVTFPMNTEATVGSVKSITTEREFEKFLRDAGYSKKEATALTLHGFKGLSGQRDAADETGSADHSAIMEAIGRLQRSIKQ